MQRSARGFATAISAAAPHDAPNAATLARAEALWHARAMFELEGIDHVALAVRDVGQTLRWYVDVLGFEHLHQGMWDGVPVFVGKGTTALALFPAREGAREPSGRPDHIGMLHLAFRATRKEFGAAQTELRQRDIIFQSEDHEISESIYFADLDGNRLEITTYEV
ncbi:MAG: VOC family protein [Chthoniobacterales bacterium]